MAGTKKCDRCGATWAGGPDDDCPGCDADGGPLGPVDQLREHALDLAAIEKIPKPDPLIAGYVDRGSLAMLYGPSGGSKTFLAVDWTLSVASGTWWHRREVERGRVVYVAAEGAAGLGVRVAAWRKHHDIYDVSTFDRVDFLPLAVNLFAAEWAGALGEYAAGAELVVVDTLARCAIGADENSAKDMGQVIANADRVRRDSGAAVLLVHHAGKDAGNGARGSSALRAAVDSEIECTSTDEVVTVKVTKRKDGEPPNPLQLVRTQVGPSCVLVRDRGQRTNLGASAAAALEALRSIAVPGGVPVGSWLDSAEMPKSTFHRARAALVAGGQVVNLGTDRAPRYLPGELLEDEA